MRAPDGKGKYGQYLYFKGEKECPTTHAGISYWWKWEQGHYAAKISEPFEQYIKGWFNKHDDGPEFVARRWRDYLEGN